MRSSLTADDDDEHAEIKSEKTLSSFRASMPRSTVYADGLHLYTSCPPRANPVHTVTILCEERPEMAAQVS